jgi:hypothetical protein
MLEPVSPPMLVDVSGFWSKWDRMKMMKQMKQLEVPSGGRDFKQQQQ